MALNFKGETTTAVLNNTENVYKKDDLFRLYDVGVLKLGNVVCEHGDFVSWTGTSWKLEKDAGYAIETGSAGESLEERVGAIEEKIPEDASEDNKLVTIADLVALEEELLSTNPPATNTLRFEFSKKDYDPVAAGVGRSGTWKKISTKFNNIWDWTRKNAYWGGSFKNAFTSPDNFVSVIGCGVLATPTAMYQMFMGCTSLKYVCSLESSLVTNFESAFSGCSSLETIETFDTTAAVTIQAILYNCISLKKLPIILSTSAMTTVIDSFNGCVSVESGALDNYNTLSDTASVVSYTNAFKDCGKNTTTGAAELAQIPASWGGTAAG